MYALVDCNNFYASCERVFRPELRNVPIVILSNNDGCVIARSNEAKKLGIKMGVPAYQIQRQVKDYGIIEFSSNYTLYGNMSQRVMSVLSSFVEDIEIYSIDEAFLNLKGFEHLGLKKYGEKITATTSKWTGIPVSMGIAPTKTLAKVANKFAKKYPAYKNVCLIDTEEKRIKALTKTEISDVWGIGRQHTKFLNKHGITNAWEFTKMPINWVRQQMTVVGERMWKELNGIPCIEFELEAPPKKQICTSRAFGGYITDLEDLKGTVATYASICAEKLRTQNSCALSLMVFIHTNQFREELPQYAANRIIKFPVPTSSTLEIVKYAVFALESIYKKNYQYKKSGVIITELIPDTAVQQSIFDKVDRNKHARLMNVVDKVNKGFSRNVLSLGIQGFNPDWKLRREKLSPCYTTRLKDIITVNCK